jgi:hypothetical protein
MAGMKATRHRGKEATEGKALNGRSRATRHRGKEATQGKALKYKAPGNGGKKAWSDTRQPGEKPPR